MSDDTADDAGTPADGPRAFRLGYVPGATPGKWARTWSERLPDVRLDLVQVEAADVAGALAAGDVDAALGRLPVDRDVFHAIQLYVEVPVVVVSRDHLLAASEESEQAAASELADDVLWVPADDVLFGGDAPRPGRAPEAYDDGTGTLVEPAPASTAEAVAWAANGSGIVVVPMSLARLHHRKDTVSRPLADGPESPVGLVWRRDGLPDATAELVEEMVGIVRGRTANSSRGRAQATSGTETKQARKRRDDGEGGRRGTGAGGRAAGSGKGGAGGRTANRPARPRGGGRSSGRGKRR
ncbi:LysR family transcriptional regulator substrate-binding protein [Isoptericola jiangsuensis]|uniref:LysR family transcriptional regulator substrate-binding protein n=1 Tax=Isoptericola jiangsuensis TaxID=548579 RepID=UPI003AB0958B